MGLGTWNVRGSCAAGLKKQVARKLQKYNLDLVAVQEVRWNNGGSQPADDYALFYGNENANHRLGKGIFVH